MAFEGHHPGPLQQRRRQPLVSPLTCPYFIGLIHRLLLVLIASMVCTSNRIWCQMYLATKTGILSAAHPILLNLRAPRQAYPYPTTTITTIRIIRTIRTITNMSLLSTTIVILIQPANQWVVAIYWWIPGPIILEKTTIIVIVTNLIKKCHMNLFLWKLQLMSPLPNVLLKCTLLRLDLLLFIPFIFSCCSPLF